MENLIRLRERLGWKTEIPRHAMGCKAAMEKLKDIPDNEKVSMGTQLLSDILELS
jgi:hypothetical protein